MSDANNFLSSHSPSPSSDLPAPLTSPVSTSSPLPSPTSEFFLSYTKKLSPSNIHMVYDWQNLSVPSSSSSSITITPATTTTIPTTTTTTSTTLTIVVPADEIQEKETEVIKEIWRYVDNYCLYKIYDLPKRRKKNYSIDKEMTSLFVEANSQYQTLLVGKILPNPLHSTSPAKDVEIIVINYAIDFGNSPTDENRGFWLHGQDGIWYKLVNSNPEYSDISDECIVLCNQYLNFYDAVVYGVGGEGKLATLNPILFKYECEYTLETIYQKSQYGFDINILRTNIPFFYHLSLPIFTTKSIFMKEFQVSIVLSLP